MTVRELDSAVLVAPVRAARWASAARARQVATDLVSITKPRIISLLLFTAVMSLLAAAGDRVMLRVALAVTGGGTLSAGGANAINCAYDGELDRRMRRTSSRPVAAGRLSPVAAAGFGVLLTVVAELWLWREANGVAAVCALGGTVWYVAVYTLWLKRRSASNIVIGGAAGCFPVLVGWSAATGSVGPSALVLALVVFLWTPPHFWALATLLRDDYRSAQVPMLPVIASTGAVATRIRVYAVATLLASLGPLTWNGFGALYGVTAAIAGVRFVRLSFGYGAQRQASVRLFHFSLLYLAVVFAAAAGDRLLGGWA